MIIVEVPETLDSDLEVDPNPSTIQLKFDLDSPYFRHSSSREIRPDCDT